MKDQMEYQTKDFYLASCLLASGVQLKRLERISPKAFAFIFPITPNTAQTIIQQHWDKELILPSKDLIDAISELKTRIYSQT